MIFPAQSNLTYLFFLILLNKFSPQPIAAGIWNSPALIAIWDAAPPYIVIKPDISCEKIQSYPGSAFSIKTTEPDKDFASEIFSKKFTLPSIILLVTKFGFCVNSSNSSMSFSEKITSGNFIASVKL